MTGPEHYRAAEDLIAKSNTVSMDDGYAQLVIAQAQAHATLALTAAMALEVTATMPPPTTDAAADWRDVLKPVGHGEPVPA